MARFLTLAACMCAITAAASGAEPPSARLSWNELGPRIVHRKVAFVLPDGTNVEGKVSAVEADGLRMKVTKSSNKATLRKGKQLVPRAGLNLLRVTEYGWKARLLVPLGAVGLVGGIVAAQQIDLYEGALVYVVPAVIAGGVTGSAIAGYYIGKRIDRRITEIAIVPDAGND